MQITIPDDAGILARTQADAAGFSDVGDYLANLVRHQSPRAIGLERRLNAIDDLRQLRRTAPKLTGDEIVALVRAGRDERP